MTWIMDHRSRSPCRSIQLYANVAHLLCYHTAIHRCSGVTTWWVHVTKWAGLLAAEAVTKPGSCESLWLRKSSIMSCARSSLDSLAGQTLTLSIACETISLIGRSFTQCSELCCAPRTSTEVESIPVLHSVLCYVYYYVIVNVYN